ncbi:4Fe-4S dicluster domain-containing protein [Desulfofundulus thermobenzoicus]|uniref:4Fe-4S dicluster domain-containing protein n=1 Tax=Desulfofundulus thermobenzoicus TaxID=29376 RepID=A0A6N7IN09_9FIRM|nr:4Fe-4S dicluster domain-containing protein [Desulfofundulus thermobenzoicus]
MRLKFDSQKCIGCRLCQLACSASHEGVFNPKLARLKINSFYSKLGLVVEGIVCTLCLQCVNTCPVDAIKYDGSKLSLDEAQCTGCMSCLDSCPEGVIVNKESIVGLCDMCNGEPQCIAWCPHEALSMVQLMEEVG